MGLSFILVLVTISIAVSWSLKGRCTSFGQMSITTTNTRTGTTKFLMKVPKRSFSTLFMITNAHEAAMQREETLRLDAIQLANQLNYKPVYVDGWESSLLTIIQNTDAGLLASHTTKKEVGRLIGRLTMAAASRAPTPLEDGRLFGKYKVSYVGTGSSQRGNPAGGKYRSRLGRLVYRIDGLYQHILSGDDEKKTIVLNYIRGTLLSFIPFAVILKGVATPLQLEERQNIRNKYNQTLSPSTVQADFLPPLIVLGNLASKWPWRGFCFTAGPASNVVLGT